MTDEPQTQVNASDTTAAPHVPSPSSLSRHRAVKPRAQSSAPAAHSAPASDPAKWGRVDASGAVFVRTKSGERQIGSWQAGDPAEGLAHFGLRFDDLVTEVDLLEARLRSHPQESRRTRAQATEIAQGLPTAAVVGDLDSLAERIAALVERSHQVEAEAKARKESDRTAAIARKEELATEAETIGESSTQWKAAGDRLRSILDEWKTIRGIDRKTDDALWKRFSAAREAFNRRRGTHFAELDRSRASARKVKQELVDKAEALSGSTEWNDTASAFRRLMDEWKAAGHAPKDSDEALWKRFKAAQDAFFDSRHAAAAEQDAEFQANATAKIAVLEEFEPQIDPENDLDGARAKLRQLHSRWEEIGKVPRDQMGVLEGRLRALEHSVKQAAEREWRRSDPEAKARAGQFWEKVSALEDQAAKAEASGNAKEAQRAREQAAQWREWAEAAEKAVDSR